LTTEKAWGTYYTKLREAKESFLNEPESWVKEDRYNKLFYMELYDLDIYMNKYIFRLRVIPSEASLYSLKLWDCPELIVNDTLSNIYLERQKDLINKIYSNKFEGEVQSLEASYELKYNIDFKLLATAREYEYNSLTPTDWLNDKYRQLLILDCKDINTRSLFADLTESPDDFFNYHIGAVVEFIQSYKPYPDITIVSIRSHILDYLLKDYKGAYSFKRITKNFLAKAVNNLDYKSLQIGFKRLNDILEVVYLNEIRLEDTEGTRGLLAAWRLGSSLTK
jgi:hypothetical protein